MCVCVCFFMYVCVLTAAHSILKEVSADQSSFVKGGSSAAAQRYAKYQVV